MSKDLQGLTEAMGLTEAEPGTLRTQRFPGAIFRTLRAQDIANMLGGPNAPYSNLDLGITGNDIMLETRLRTGKALQRETRLRPDKAFPVPATNILEMETPPTQLRVIAKREMTRESNNKDTSPMVFFPDSEPEIWAREVVIPTAYPEIAEKGVQLSEIGYGAYLYGNFIPTAGQTESIVRNSVYGKVQAGTTNIVGTLGVDVVRTGGTLKKYALEGVGNPLLEAYAGLYRKGNIPEELNPRLEEFTAFLRESMEKAGLKELRREDGESWNTIRKWLLKAQQLNWVAGK